MHVFLLAGDNFFEFDEYYMNQIGNDNNVVIVGSGLAGYTVAREFRKLDKESPLIIITADDGSFYAKPNLSNLHAHKKTPDQLVSASSEKMAHDLNATVLTHSKVTKFDPEHNTLWMGQKALTYHQLVIATGAITRALPHEVDPDHCAISVNSLNDFRLYDEKVKTAKHITIIGSGLIGCEFANDLVLANKSVTVIGNTSLPMQPLLPEPAATGLKAALMKAGVNWLLDARAAQIKKIGSRIHVTLADKQTIETDIVLSAIGLMPDTRLASECGLQVNRGIVVDENLQTSRQHIYALGDCAEIYGTVSPFVMPIMHAAKALAKTLTGIKTKVEFPPMPIVVKTPAYPIAMVPPSATAHGAWRFEEKEGGVFGEFRGDDNQLRGFCLTGAWAVQRATLLKEMSA